MLNEKANYKVHLNKLCKHIAHDLQKGLTGQLYTWQNVTVETGTNNTRAIIKQNGLYCCTLSSIIGLPCVLTSEKELSIVKTYK